MQNNGEHFDIKAMWNKVSVDTFAAVLCYVTHPLMQLHSHSHKDPLIFKVTFLELASNKLFTFLTQKHAWHSYLTGDLVNKWVFDLLFGLSGFLTTDLTSVSGVHSFILLTDLWPASLDRSEIPGRRLRFMLETWRTICSENNCSLYRHWKHCGCRVFVMVTPNVQ